MFTSPAGRNTTAPNTAWDRVVAITAARITGTKPATVYSIMTTSIAKITPAIGVLKEAAMAAAVPQADITLRLLLGKRRPAPNRLLAAAPI